MRWRNYAFALLIALPMYWVPFIYFHNETRWPVHVQESSKASIEHERRTSGNDNAKDMHAQELNKDSYFLKMVPPVPRNSSSNLVLPIPEMVKKYFLHVPKRTYNESVLILTPIHNSEYDLDQYFDMIKSLSYPHHLISVALGEDSSTDNTVEAALKSLKLLSDFNSGQVFHFNYSHSVHGPWGQKHLKAIQLKRRMHLAVVRNDLLRKALSNEDWVIWIDSDIQVLPEDIIQQLIWADKDVVTPCCLSRGYDVVRSYDRNIWRETNESLAWQRTLPSDYLVLEGYGPVRRIYIHDLRGEGRLVPIDGVGGCTLLVRGRCHRNGLIFPEKVYKHSIETEGLARMAQDMGYSVYGLPFVEIFH